MISVIFNVYKRPYSLEEQIASVKSQEGFDIKSEDIHVWYNATPGIEQHLPKDPAINTYQCNWNTKFFGRFTLPLLCKTPYIALFDDDVIPGKLWFKNCIDTMQTHNGILGTTGVILQKYGYSGCAKTGWNMNPSPTTNMVDLVGHGWFFKREWTKYMWLEDPPSWDNGEDMFFSYVAKKHGINTYVPPHPSNNIELWGNVPDRAHGWGSDAAANYKHDKTHGRIRNQVAQTLIDKGWQTVRGIKK